MTLAVAADKQPAKLKLKPKGGYVSDETTATRIAQAVWAPLFGDSVAMQKPFRVTLQGNVWIVIGSTPEWMHTGFPVAEISKDDGRVINVYTQGR